MYSDRYKGLVTAHGLISIGTIMGAFYFLIIAQILVGRMRAEQVNLTTYSSVIFVALLFGLPEISKLYAHGEGPRMLHRLRHSWKQFIVLTFSLFAFFFITRDNQISRFFLIQFLLCSGALLAALNCLLPIVLPTLLFPLQSRLPALIIGSGESIRNLLPWADDRSNLGLEIGGAILFETDESVSLPIPVLGTLNDLPKLLDTQNYRTLLVGETPKFRHALPLILKLALSHGCRLVVRDSRSAEFGGWLSPRLEGTDVFYGFANEPLENPLNRGVKRGLDLAVSLPVCLFILPPLALLVAFMQRRQSPGPLFFRQSRHGRDRRIFSIFKFRTMNITGHVAREDQQAQRNDPRIYPFGAFLRRSSLDEVPQFLNVLFGHMSVVGPRPHLVDHDHTFSKGVEAYWTRHFAKPGITGLAQIKGFRGEITEPALLQGRVDNDLAYIRSWNLWRDVSIILRTFLQIFSPPKTAY